MSSDGGELDYARTKRYTCEATLFRCQCSVLECTSTAQPYRKAPTHYVHGPQLAMQMLSCIDTGVANVVHHRWCASHQEYANLHNKRNACRASKRSPIVSAWTWQELPNQEVLVIYRTQRAVCKQPPCLVKESGTSMLITYCHCRLFIHAQSWLPLASQTCPQQLHLKPAGSA
jgi:hypothetical protein